MFSGLNHSTLPHYTFFVNEALVWFFSLLLLSFPYSTSVSSFELNAQARQGVLHNHMVFVLHKLSIS